MTEDDLDSLFAQARGTGALAPSDQLMARVLADAAALQPQAPGLARAPAAARPGFWALVLAALGGAGMLAGMTTAVLAGLWVGFAQPVGEGVFAAVLGSDTATIDMMPGIDALLEEAP